MERLIKGTAAYRSFARDVKRGELSHAYLLLFNDKKNEREVLKTFAELVFDGDRRVRAESLPDLMIYPDEGKKYTADGVGEIISDSALRPVGGDKKLYILLGFDGASAIVQNKLLKTLEEPPEGAHFLLCAASTAPVLDTVLSRVRLLSIPPFSEGDILSALKREGDNPLNERAAASCNGVLGVAENMVSGGWFKGVLEGAEEICTANSPADISRLSQKYGDTPYKRELLSEMERLYFSALTGEGAAAKIWTRGALLYAVESVNRASADITFNAYFQGLLYDLMLRVQKENDKWLKLSE